MQKLCGFVRGESTKGTGCTTVAMGLHPIPRGRSAPPEGLPPERLLIRMDDHERSQAIGSDQRALNVPAPLRAGACSRCPQRSI